MQEKVRLTPEILLSFSDIYLQKSFDDPKPTPRAHLEWWHYCCLNHRYVALAAPRGHAKSTAITLTFVLASICLRSKRHVLIISDTVDQACLHLGNITQEIRENENLRRTFGVKKILKDNEGELIILWEDNQQTRVAAHGSGQKIRGTNWRKTRPDLIIGDDLENDELVMNEERRDKFRRWFWQTLVPIGGSKAEIRIVGTILHEDSLLSRFMPNPINDKQCKIEPLRVTTRAVKAFTSALYRAHPDFDDFSQLLWPENWDEERLKHIRQGFIEDGFPEGYSQEYLNNPMAAEGAYFQDKDLAQIPLEERDPSTKSPEQYFVGVDLAISEKSRRAYSVFIVVGYGNDKILRVREVVRRRMDSLEIMETFFHLHRKWKNKAARDEEPVFLVEKENIAKAIGPYLYKEMDEQNEYLVIEEMPPIHDKELRARSIQARTRAGRVEFDHEASWWPTFRHELITFPRSTYADQVDAFAWVGHYIANMHEPPSHKELEEDEWYESWEEVRHLPSFMGKRNRFTGY